MPGEKADVGRHQRQHAGREEAQQPRGERDEEPERGRLAHSAPELPLAALAADAVDLDPVALVLEAVLVGDDRQHPLEPLVLELDHAAAALADQVLVVGLRRHRLVALEPLAEVVRAHQAALDQHLERAVDGGGADVLAALLERAADAFDRGMVVGEEDDLGDEVALAGDGLAVLAEIAAEALEEGRALVASEAGHRRRGREPALGRHRAGAAARRRCGAARRCSSWASASTGPLPTSSTEASNFPRSLPLMASM